jgi:hypothetical protein
MLRIALFAALMSLAVPAAALAQTYDPPRTPEGRPDLQGTWSSLSIVATERPKGLPLVADAALAEEFANSFWQEQATVEDPDIAITGARSLSLVRGELRTSHIYDPPDGRFPYTPEGEAMANRGMDSSVGRNANPEERPTYERCLAGFGQPPLRSFPIDIPTQIVQTPEAVVFWTEDVAGGRIAYFDRPLPPESLRSHTGWSAASWQGDTLVIETTHLLDGDHWRTDWGRPIVVEADSRVIERFTRLADDELLYEFTVEEDNLYARPWRAEYVFRPFDGVILEYACHEANHSIMNVLRAGRVADGWANAAASPAQ